MEAAIIVILKYVAAIILSLGAWKGGEAGYKKFRGQKEILPTVSPDTCYLKHKNLDEKLTTIKEDIKDIKVSIDKALDLRVELIGVKGELREDIHEEISEHEDRYHKVA